MRRVAALMAVVLFSAAACSNKPSDVTVSAPGDNATGIAVTGEGEVTGTPDVLSISLGVSVKRDSVDTAVSESATLADALIDALKGAGIDEADIQTENYSIQPQFRYSQGEEIPDGFRVDNAVRVKLRELDRAGEVIDVATDAGGDQVRVQGVAFSLEDNEELLAQAREKAWEDARAKATQLAELSGQQLGDAVQISETLGGGPVMFEAGAGALAATGGDTPIEPGELTTSVQIEARFELED